MSNATYEPAGSLRRLSILHRSWTAAAVMSTKSDNSVSNFITVCAFIPPFFLPFFGFLPTPLSIWEKRAIVVESRTYRWVRISFSSGCPIKVPRNACKGSCTHVRKTLPDDVCWHQPACSGVLRSSVQGATCG